MDEVVIHEPEGHQEGHEDGEPVQDSVENAPDNLGARRNDGLAAQEGIRMIDQLLLVIARPMSF